jgi:hypothetical protein
MTFNLRKVFFLASPPCADSKTNLYFININKLKHRFQSQTSNLEALISYKILKMHTHITVNTRMKRMKNGIYY